MGPLPDITVSESSVGPIWGQILCMIKLQPNVLEASIRKINGVMMSLGSGK